MPGTAGISGPARRSPGLGRAAHRARHAAPGDHPPPQAPDALALADLEDALAEWLARRHGADREWLIAPSLAAAAGADIAWCERAAAVLDGPALGPGLEWTASALSAVTLLADVKESTRRISALVTAVKSYTQMDRASLSCVHVTDGIESTLVMLGHMLGDGITVERRYDADVPPVDAHAGELNMVWTDLIANAVEAMSGKGTLFLSTRVSQGNVVIEVADTGCGMPSQVAARAFEPLHAASSRNATAGPSTSIPGLGTRSSRCTSRFAPRPDYDSECVKISGE